MDSLSDYKRFRDMLFEGNLSIVREDLLPLINKLYMFLLYRTTEYSKATADTGEVDYEAIMYFWRDFLDTPYSKVINRAYDIFAENQQVKDYDSKLKSLKECIISRPRADKPGEPEVELSQFAYELIITLIERDNLSLLKEFIFFPGFPELKKKKETESAKE